MLKIYYVINYIYFFKQGMISLILATDMARHSEILDKFKSQVEGNFDFNSAEHLNSVSVIKIFIMYNFIMPY